MKSTRPSTPDGTYTLNHWATRVRVPLRTAAGEFCRVFQLSIPEPLYLTVGAVAAGHTSIASAGLSFRVSAVRYDVDDRLIVITCGAEYYETKTDIHDDGRRLVASGWAEVPEVG